MSASSRAALADEPPASAIIQTPLGEMTLSSRGDAVVALQFSDRGSVSPHDSTDAEQAARVQGQLDDYFSGSLTEFSLPLALEGCGDFQRRVLEQCSRIAYGERATYGLLASQIGAPGAARAVGNALRRNPIALLIPCHRVTRADGSLGGYGGEDSHQRKRALLALETSS